MDLTGTLVDTCLRIYPSQHFTTFLKTLPDEEDIPINILKLIGRNCKGNLNEDIKHQNKVHFNDSDLKNIKEISDFVKANTLLEPDENEPEDDSNKNDMSVEKKETSDEKETCTEKEACDKEEKLGNTPEKQIDKDFKVKEPSDNEDSTEVLTPEKKLSPFITTSDIDWLYNYLQKRKSKGDKVPYLHALLEGANLEMPENKIIKRNPVLEARCVKLRAQEEARVYRKMTKGVDNVRLRFPEDSISYQMKQLNRHLIAIGQFLLSIFAGFLFGFRGIEWIVGNLDFGFRLLLGVMCALVIALAEIYFLAKKLNEELSIPETVQLGGPPKFKHLPNPVIGKEHQD